MINGFTEHTSPLTDKELGALPVVEKALKNAYGANNAIYNDQLRKITGLTSARVRKLINHIRTNGIVKCVVASSKGYYIASSEQELLDYEESLMGRESAIREVRRAIADQRMMRYSGVLGMQGKLF